MMKYAELTVNGDVRKKCNLLRETRHGKALGKLAMYVLLSALPVALAG